jgi:hypothetical protein
MCNGGSVFASETLLIACFMALVIGSPVVAMLPATVDFPTTPLPPLTCPPVRYEFLS